VGELKRLVKVHKAYQHMNAGDLAMEHGDTEAARREYGAAEALIPDNVEMAYWHAIALANAGEVEASLPVFKGVFERDGNWAVLTPRLVPVELLNVSEVDLERILNQAP
jgi:lipoprotein NlpI